MDRKLLERIIEHLKARYDCDHEYMDADAVAQLQDDIIRLQSMLPRTIVEVFGCYCPSCDITFIMKNNYIGSELHTAECVGWYHGEPTEEDNKLFDGKLVAMYDFL